MVSIVQMIDALECEKWVREAKVEASKNANEDNNKEEAKLLGEARIIEKAIKVLKEG